MQFICCLFNREADNGEADDTFHVMTFFEG
jgi:hypothetical protein